jgi:hypothetical protein
LALRFGVWSRFKSGQAFSLQLAGTTSSLPDEVGAVRWTRLGFGKYAELTLPRLIVVDPDWFFWTVLKRIFRGYLAEQTADLNRKASSIRIFRPDPEQWNVEYSFDCDGRLLEFMFVKLAEAGYCSKWSYRSKCLDFSCICRTGRDYDKAAGKALIRDFRRLYFDDKNLTKRGSNGGWRGAI